MNVYVETMSMDELETSLDYAKYVRDTVGLDREDYVRACKDIVQLEAEMLKR